MNSEPRIARYVQSQGYAKPSYATESFAVRGWPGLAIIVDALERVGHKVGYCSSATVDRHQVILVSITSSCDWWSYIAERITWPDGQYTTIVGGSGVMNIRPFLAYADAFVFGRGEVLIVPMVEAALSGVRYRDPAICWSDEFSPDEIYQFSQGAGVYGFDVRLENGKTWTERASGCQRRCYFCGYTWQRKHTGGLQSTTGAAASLWNRPDEEVTIWDLDLDRPESWPKVKLIGIDGSSERLRRMVNKPITREMLMMFFRGLVERPSAGLIRMYNIVGLPSETPRDWDELIADAKAAVSGVRVDGNPRFVALHCTPFRPMPATPAACWPTQLLDFRKAIPAYFGLNKPRGPLYVSDAIRLNLDYSTESLPTHALEMIALRGTEADAATVLAVARTRRFWSARSDTKLATLRANFDLDRLFGAYDPGDLPTRYLRTWAPVEKTWGRPVGC